MPCFRSGMVKLLLIRPTEDVRDVPVVEQAPETSLV